jgi:hypothetical protein
LTRVRGDFNVKSSVVNQPDIELSIDAFGNSLNEHVVLNMSLQACEGLFANDMVNEIEYPSMLEVNSINTTPVNLSFVDASQRTTKTNEK